MPFDNNEINNIPNVLSTPRFGRYLSETQGDITNALELYQWNLEVSSALLVPLQIYEITIRNSISSVIEQVYGNNWAFSNRFHISLPNPQRAYNPRREIQRLSHLTTSGAVVAELKFFFWQKMLTGRHDGTMWNSYFRNTFPNTDPTKTVQVLRNEAYICVNEIRLLRNRIAHHEPIFDKNIIAEYDRIIEAISHRCHITAGWINRIETVKAKVLEKP